MGQFVGHRRVCRLSLADRSAFEVDVDGVPAGGSNAFEACPVARLVARPLEPSLRIRRDHGLEAGVPGEVSERAADELREATPTLAGEQFRAAVAAGGTAVAVPVSAVLTVG